MADAARGNCGESMSTLRVVSLDLVGFRPYGEPNENVRAHAEREARLSLERMIAAGALRDDVTHALACHAHPETSEPSLAGGWIYRSVTGPHWSAVISARIKEPEGADARTLHEAEFGRYVLRLMVDGEIDGIDPIPFEEFVAKAHRLGLIQKLSGGYFRDSADAIERAGEIDRGRLRQAVAREGETS